MKKIKKIHVKKRLIILLFFLFKFFTFSQTNFWVQITPPNGGNITSFTTNDNNYYFVGVKNKGVFRSFNQGSIWQPIGLNNTTITALNIKNNIIYAGSENDGIFLSRDNGESWQLLNSNLIGEKINCLEFYNNLLLIGTDNGLFSCNTDGSNVTQITNGIPNIEIRSIKVTNSGNIYIATKNGFYHSNNTMVFQPLNNGLISLNLYAIEISPSNDVFIGGEEGLYKLNYSNIWQRIDTNKNIKNIKSILITNNNQIYIANEKLFFSADSGKTFNEIIPDTINIRQLKMDRFGVICLSSSKGFYSNKSSVWSNIGIPLNLYVNQIITEKNFFVYCASTDGLFRYNLQTSTWKNLTENLDNISVYSFTKDSTGIIYIGTPNGIFKSTNEGNQWIKSNAGLLNFNINQIKFYNDILFCATKNGLFRSTDFGGNWKQLLSIPSNVSVNCIQKVNENTLLAGTSVGLFISKDKGNFWQQKIINNSNFEISYIGINKSGTIIIGNYYSLYKSTDYGESWTTITNNYSNGNIKCIALNPSGEFYLGSNYGIFRSINAGASYTQINSGLTNIDIRDIIFSESGYLFCGTNGGGIFKSLLLTPETPKLEYPQNNSVNIPKEITLRWTGSNSTLLYRIQVSEKYDFSTLFIEDIVVSTNFTLRDLKDYTTYYWRVNASNGVGESDWSEIWQFKTEMTPPPPPKLLYPQNNENYVSTSPILKWTESERSLYYELQISEKQDFSTYLYYYAFIYNNQQIISDLKDNTTYYWKVRGVNIGGVGKWSEVWTFTTLSKLPYTPNLIYPENLSNISNTQISFKWNKVINANYYSFNLSKEQSFTNNIIDTTNYNDTLLTVNSLIPGIYYWRVKSHNSFGESVWSKTYGFILNVNSINKFSDNFEYKLFQNYPNPFNPSTNISFALARSGFVKILLYDTYGKVVDIILDKYLNAGNYSITYTPIYLSSGLYFYKLITTNFTQTKKMLFLK